MTAPEVPAVVIPDGIEPVEAYRCWNLGMQGLGMQGLRSLNGEWWSPGEPLTAKCASATAILYTWMAERGALMTHEEAVAFAERHNRMRAAAFTPLGHARFDYIPAPPSLALPAGYGLRLKSEPVITHLVPDEGCTCGIYAASTRAGVPKGGHVYGKVNLWGKVVPGERGWRAQYAYPSEFHVPAELADDPTLLAFGVPIIVAGGKSADEDENTDWTLLAPDLTFAPGVRRWRPGWLAVAIALNLASAALNMSRAMGIW